MKHLLANYPGLAMARIGPRTLLHVATDWPGHFPDGPDSVAVLIDAGADVNASRERANLLAPPPPGRLRTFMDAVRWIFRSPFE